MADELKLSELDEVTSLAATDLIDISQDLGNGTSLSSSSSSIGPYRPGYEDILDLETSRYRFSGYQLPMVTLDETGPAYIWLVPHPGNRNHPDWHGAKAVTIGTSLEHISLADNKVMPVLPFGED